MRILVSNDDGIYSPGIAALAKAAKALGEVRIVAPDVEQSSASHAITASRPLAYRHTPLHIDGVDAFRVNGTPADCVALGAFNWENVELVLSGINLGSNLGNALWHSGTLAAAKQAALLGIRAIAFSTPIIKDELPNFDKLDRWVRRVLEMLIPEKELPLVNVNFPNTPEDPKGIQWTRQSVRQYDGKIVPGEDPMGRRHFWFTTIPLQSPEEGTDRCAIERGFISVTPLSLDLTDQQLLARVLTRQASQAQASAPQPVPT